MTENEFTEKSREGTEKSALVSRREFVSTVAAASAAFMIVPRHVLGRGMQAPSDLVNIATVGINGQGAINTRAVMSQNVVAICDCDFGLLEGRLQAWRTAAARIAPVPGEAPAGGRQGGAGGAGRQGGPPEPSPWRDFEVSKAQLEANARWPAQDANATVVRFANEQLPRLKKYQDYREMLEKQKDIDAVIIATPDHMHAPIASAAMDLGKHVYVQKPMCWSVNEARHLSRKGRGEESRRSHGQSEPLARQRPARRRAHSVRRHRRRARGARLDESPARLLAAGRAAAVGAHGRSGAGALELPGPDSASRRRDERHVSRAGRVVMGSLPRLRASGRIPPAVPSVQLARLGRLGTRRARRHGRASHGLPGLVVEARTADDDSDDLHAVQRRVLSDGDHDALRVPGAQRAPGREADLVRRRFHAARSPKNWARSGSIREAASSTSGAKARCSSSRTRRGCCRWRATTRSSRRRSGSRASRTKITR